MFRDYIQRYARPKNRCWRDTARALGFKPDPQDDELLVRTDSGVLKSWDGRLIQSIAKRDVLKMLDGLMVKYPIAANRRLATLRKLFGWCVERDILRPTPAKALMHRPPSKAATECSRTANLKPYGGRRTR